MSLDIEEKSLRKKIYRKINKIKKKEFYFQIYQILLDNKEIFNSNNNGVFFDLYKLSKKSINKINDILVEDNSIIVDSVTEENISYRNYSEEQSSNKVNLNN